MKNLTVPGLLALYCLVAGAGWFLGPSFSTLSLVSWLTGYLLTAFAVAYRYLFSDRRFDFFPFAVLAAILLNFFVQITGGVHSFLWPAYFVFGSAVAVMLPLLRTLAMSVLIVAIEASNLFASSQWNPERVPVYAAFALALIAVPGVISHIIRRTRKEVEQVRDEHERLIEHADAIDPLDGHVTVEALSEESQLASNIKAARRLEASFSGLIDMIYQFVPAHAYALFLKERTGEDSAEAYVLRARKSELDEIFLGPLGHVVGAEKDQALITTAIRSMHVQYDGDLAEAVNPGYYLRRMPIKSILAVPILDDGAVIGLLVLDSLEPGAFSVETQDMISRFAPFFIQIIEKTRATQELGMRAKTFAAMHKMSSVLNSTLELNEMLDRLTKEIATLVAYDFCVFIQYDEKTKTVSLVHHSGSVTFSGEEISLLEKISSSLRPVGSEAGRRDEKQLPLEEGTLLNQMLNQWQKQQSSPYHFQDLADRAVVGLLDSTTGLTRQLRSLSCWPLATGEKFIGAFFLGSLRTHAFSEFHRSFLDTLSNQIALVMDNAILHSQISNLARTDGLTGLLNHRTFMEKLSEEYKRIDRERRPFSVLLTDIDKFKSVNDTYGHPVGDQAIKAVARVLKETVRATDFVARYGGEEFAVGMVDTSTAGAEQMAERVRKIMEKTVAAKTGAKDLMITISIGVASFPDHTQNPAELVTLADNALYEAKRSGRNRVCVGKKAAEAKETVA